LIPLAGGRSSFALVLLGIPHAVRDTLFFFFLIFLLRVLLRNQWLAAAGFAAIFAALNLVSGPHPKLDAGVSFVVLFGFAFLVLRWGLLALATTLLVGGVARVPLAAQTSVWYFGGTALTLAAAAVLAIWAFRTTIGNQKLWTAEL
jgi:hypothetical protein